VREQPGACHPASDRPAGRRCLDDDWQLAQENFGRTCRITLKRAAHTQASGDVSPKLRSGPPQSGHAQGPVNGGLAR